MIARVSTVTFQGIDVLDVNVQVQMTSGFPTFRIVGLPDKAVAESRERVRAALSAMGLALPPKWITVNLSPADILTEASHFDLPIALGSLAAMDVLPVDEIIEFTALGELALDGLLAPILGVLPAAIHANSKHWGLICPNQQGGRAAWAGDVRILAPTNLLALINHFKETQILSVPSLSIRDSNLKYPDLADIRGQENGKRALEMAAAGVHNMLVVGPPGSSKSMFAQRLSGLLPTLDASKTLEVSMIRSLSGGLGDTGPTPHRPFRDPHHSASTPSLVGGGMRAKPSEVSLAHLGVLFLDELPKF
jgi:magnesium chelatase family protein